MIKDFHFNSGEVLPELRIHYVTLGKPHRDFTGRIDKCCSPVTRYRRRSSLGSEPSSRAAVWTKPGIGLPVETNGRNRLWRHIVVEAIRNDPEWKNGDYRQQPRGYTRIAPLVVIMTGNPVRQFEAYPTREAADAWYQRLMTSASQVDVNDALYWYDASSDYNPAPDLEKIKAKLFAIEFEDDKINAPEFAALDREMRRVKNGRYAIIPAVKQSNGEAGNIANGELWVAHLRDLLGSLTH